METERIAQQDEIRKALVENRQKGETYCLAFKANPQREFVGIPIAPPGGAPENDAQFELKSREGKMVRGPLHEVAWMQKA